MTSIMIGAMGISVLVRVDDAPALVEELLEVIEGLGHVPGRALEGLRVGQRRAHRLRLGTDRAEHVEQAEVEGAELIEHGALHPVQIEEPSVAAAGELDATAQALEAARQAVEARQPGESAGLGEAGLVPLESADHAVHLLDETHPDLLVSGPGVLAV